MLQSRNVSTHNPSVRKPVGQDRRDLTGVSPGQLSSRVRLAAVILASLGVCGLSAQAQSGINLVLDTGFNSPLPSRVTANPTLEYITVGPNNPTAVFNGVTIRYIGTESVAPRVTDPLSSGQTAVGTMGKFVVLGDLNLASGQRIFGVGSNLIRLEVGNNASFASGSGIDVSAEGRLSGAGGGMGGGVNASPINGASPFYRYITRDRQNSGAAGGIGGLGLFNSNLKGTDGMTSIGQEYLVGGRFVSPGSAEYAGLFRSVAGGAGQAGQGNLAISAGGVEQVYKGFNTFPDPDRGVAELKLAVQGEGGKGGNAGFFNGPFDLIGSPAENGGNGGNGGAGQNGLAGANAAPIQSLLNPAVVSLRGGNGGGAGATGGAGLPGGHGGGGGGGGASTPGLISGQRNFGDSGGDGGIAGLGGEAGLGGAGGGGGGGIQFVVRGSLQIANNAGFNAAGGLGETGRSGGQGLAGGGGEPGVNAGDSAGNGGNGGNGGRGGNGGNGGVGMGGSGGVVQVVASNLTFNGSINTAGGFSGDFSTRSADGERYFHAFSGPSAGLSTQLYFGARAAGDNPYRSHSTTIAFGGAPAGQFANVPSINGGAAPYGVIAEDPTLVPISNLVENFASQTTLPAKPGHLRVGAVTRVNARWLASMDVVDFLNNEQDLLLYTAFGTDVKRPALKSVDPTHSTVFGDYIPSAPIRLREGNGYLNDPSINPNAIAPTDMLSLPARKTFAMYTSGTQQVTATFTPYGQPRTFVGTPTSAGPSGAPGASTVYLEDRGMAFLGINATSNSAPGIGGFENDAELSGDYGSQPANILNIRAGDTGTAKATVYGIGNVGTAVSGEVRIRTLKPQFSPFESGPFFTQIQQSYSGIAVDQGWESLGAEIVTTGLPIGTTQRVAEAIISPDYDDTLRTLTYPVSARIFGPTPKLLGEGLIENTFTMPTIGIYEEGLSGFVLQNVDELSGISRVWRDAIRQTPGLVRLTVLDYELIDPAGVFSVSGLSEDPLVLNGNQMQSINIGFDPNGVFGTYSATLRLLTDVNAPVGQAGSYYTINLSASAIPEPSSAMLLGGAMGLLLRRKRSSF